MCRAANSNKQRFIMKRLLIFASTLLAAAVAHAAPVAWKYDASHTRIGFSISHLIVSSVAGRFKQATANVVLDDADMTKSQVSIEIAAASIDTDEPKRDDHLRSPDFFDVKKFPKITFKSTKIIKAGNAYKLTGDLTIRDVTKPVTLDASISQPVRSPFGFDVRGAKLSGVLKRSDFGLKWNKALEAGGVAVGDDVTLDIQVEVTK
jgi:polyisoprenoid-binding protein YceI